MVKSFKFYNGICNPIDRIDRYWLNILEFAEPFNSATLCLPFIILLAISLALSLAGLKPAC
jgi:hypothetical protein